MVMDESGPAAAAMGAGGLTETTPPQRAPALHPDRVPVLVWVIAAVFVALELALSGRYGFMQDELYFIYVLTPARKPQKSMTTTTLAPACWPRPWPAAPPATPASVSPTPGRSPRSRAPALRRRQIRRALRLMPPGTGKAPFWT